MKTPCPDTILLVTRDRLLRADLSAGRAIGVTDLYEEHRLSADDLVSRVEATLRLGKRNLGKVWVLAGDLWTQTLSLPPEALTGLSHDDITRALGFEAEPYSGLGAVDAAMAAVPLAGEGRQKQFWLSELPSAQLEQIEFLVRQSGGRLLGISHPGGLLAPLDEGTEAPWRRIELWPDAIIAIQCSATGAAKVTVVNTDAKPGRWRNDVQGLDPGGSADAAAHWLHATRSLPLEELPKTKRLTLEDSATQRQFLAAWARQIASAKAAEPRIVLPRRPISDGVRYAVAAAIGAVAIAACIVAQLSINSRCQRLSAETQKLTASAKQVATLKSDNDKLQKDRDALKTSCDKLKEDLDHYRQVMRAQRQRLVTMLTVLTKPGQEDLLIRKIEGTQNQIVLHGLCIETQFADHLASAMAGALAEALGPEGWQVQPPTRQSKEMLAGGGPWEFEVHIQDPEIKTPLPAKGAAGPAKGLKPPVKTEPTPAKADAGPVRITGVN